MQLREQVIDALGDGALTYDELTARIDAPPEQIHRLVQLSPSFTLIGERIAYVPALLDGTRWVVPIDADDAADSGVAPGGFVRMRPHLGMIAWWLIDGAVPALAPDGTELGTIETDGVMLDGVDTDIITCAPGWLGDVAGGWAEFAVHDETITITPVDGPPEPTAEQLAAIAAAFSFAVEQRDSLGVHDSGSSPEVVSPDSIVHAALLSHRDAFTGYPAPPVLDLLTAAGLEHRDGLVAAADFDWDAFSSWQRRNRLRMTYSLDDEQVELVQMLVGACELHTAEGDAAFGEPSEWPGAGLLLAAALDDPYVTAAFSGETIRRAVTFDELRSFAEALDRHARGGGSERNEGVAAVLARAHALLGDEERAIELLDATVDTSTRHSHLLHLAAEIAADRGRAADARQLVLRTGATPYDPESDDRRRPWQGGPTEAQRLLAEVEPYARPRARRDVGRNSPCPCGSGKKYKACHLGKEEAPLVERAPWLYEKCTRYVRSRVPAALDDVAAEITERAPELYYAIADSPIVEDIVLHDHGIDRDFLRARGSLLPEDEQLLAAQWALVERSVFEVEDVRRRPAGGGELRLRDLGTGDIVVVTEVHLGDQIEPGVVLLGRPLPVDDTHRAYGAFWPLHRSQANAAIDAIAAHDPDALCEIMAARLRPPTLENTDGDPMEWHRITWWVDATGDAVAAALAEAGADGPNPGAEPDATSWSIVRDSANQRDTVIASIDVIPGDGGSELIVQVNSEERAEEVDDLVSELFPDAELIDDEVLDLDDLDEMGPPDGDEEAPFDLDNDPEALEALERFIAEYERDWLDQHIPALKGRTPREAVQDPIGREEVLQLLASFPEPPPGTHGMSAARLREALGL